MWWSPTFGEAPGDEAAQYFHFDFDPAPFWLHFFIYLTDVGPDNGPHVYVRGTHLSGRPQLKPLISRGYVRISDAEMVDKVGKENIVELCGSRGTILAVDTRGYHKGKMPTANHRLVAQMIFACPQFNIHAPRQPLPSNIVPELATALHDRPSVYERFR